MTVHGDVISHVNVSQVAVEDGGEYTCTAENRAGKVSHSARLNVYGEYDRKRWKASLSALLHARVDVTK